MPICSKTESKQTRKERIRQSLQKSSRLSSFSPKSLCGAALSGNAKKRSLRIDQGTIANILREKTGVLGQEDKIQRLPSQRNKFEDGWCVVCHADGKHVFGLLLHSAFVSVSFSREYCVVFFMRKGAFYWYKKSHSYLGECSTSAFSVSFPRQKKKKNTNVCRILVIYILYIYIILFLTTVASSDKIILNKNKNN